MLEQTRVLDGNRRLRGKGLEQLQVVVLGAGVAGLRGMLPATQLSELQIASLNDQSGALWLIRPLLDTTRAEIEKQEKAVAAARLLEDIG